MGRINSWERTPESRSIDERGGVRLRLNEDQAEESEDEDRAACESDSGNLLTLIRKELLIIPTGSCPINMSEPIKSPKEDSTLANLSDGAGNEEERAATDEDNTRRSDNVDLFELKVEMRESRELINGRPDS